MALQNISYTNKEAINVNPDVADINKVKADDMNEIKSVVNNNANALADYVKEQGTTTAGGTTWTYVKWNSGKIDLYATGSKTSMTIATASGGTYYGVNAKLDLTLPFTLSSVLYIGVQETSPRSSGIWAYGTSISGTTLTTEFRSFAAINNNGACGCSYHVVGTI